MTDPRVCILVLNWNGVEDTLACLDSLSRISYSQATSVVIDNGSQDDSVLRIRKAFPDIHMIELPENLFFGGGNNAGLTWAMDQGYDFVVFLNNDTLVEPNFIEPLLAALANDDQVGMAGPLICYSAKPDTIWYGGGVVNLWTGVVAHRHIRSDVAQAGTQTIPTDYITGCCVMMPTDLALTLEGFDPIFSMYGEDVDLSLRCRTMGRKLVFVPGSKIYHKVSASIGGEFGARKLMRKAGGMLKIYKRHVRWYQWGTLIGSQILLTIYNLARVVMLKLQPAK